MRCLLRLSAIVALYGLSGCSGMSSLLPIEVDGPRASIKLAAPGQVVVRQAFRAKRDRCRTIREALAVKVRRGGAGSVPMTVTCNDASGELIAESSFQPAGEYSVSLSKKRWKYGSRPAILSVRYRKADFKSSEDMMPEGAQPLEPNQKAKGDVQYHAGDQTDWIRIVGKSASVSLLFLPESKNDVEAEVFAAMPGNLGVRKLGTLSGEAPRRFPLGSDDLVVRVRAKEMAKGTSYTLIRRDSEAVRRARVQVVDCYPIGGGMGMAILRASDPIQVNDGVVISATNADGKRRTLGKCTVTSVTGSEASCQLPYSDGAEWVDFRADGVFSGGKA